MSAHVRIQTGDTERIVALILDAALAALTGKTDILVSIWREKGSPTGQFLDWSDMTFKTSGWTTRQAVMTELSATNAPGEYYKDFDTSTIVSPQTDDTYHVRVEQSPGTDAANVPQVGEIKVGQWPDHLDQDLSTTESNIRGSDSDDLKDISDEIAALNDLSQADVQSALTSQGYTTTRAPYLDELAAANIPADVDTLLGRLTVGRAANLDNLDQAISTTQTNITNAIAALNDLSQADVQAAMTAQGYTAARAPNLDNLDQAISALNDLSIADVQTALDNQGYTSVRAALLDNLSDLDAAISSVLTAIGALNDLSSADVQAAMTAQGYTTVRAALLDNLDGAISGIPAAVDVVLTAAHGAGLWTGSGGGGDWTSTEKEQIRFRLAMDGTQTDPTTGTGTIEDILADTAAIDSRLPADPSDESNQLAAHAQTQADIAALNDLSQADVQAAMTAQGYTAARAPNLDNLDAAISDVPADVDTELAGNHGAGQWTTDGAALADAVWDEPKASHVAAGSFGEELQDKPSAAEVDTELTGSHGAGSWQGDTKANIAAEVWDTVLAGHAGVGTFGKEVQDKPSAAEVDTELSGTHGSGSWEGETKEDIADQVWDEAKSGHTGAGSFGEELQDKPSAAEVDTELSGTHGAGSWQGGGTPADIADAVWDEAKSGHTGAGSFGEEVQSHATPTEVKAQADQALVDFDPPTKAELDTAESNIRGADSDDLKTLSDQIDSLPADTDTELSTQHGGGSWEGDAAASAIADAVWDESTSGHVAPGSFGAEVQTHATAAEVLTQVVAALTAQGYTSARATKLDNLDVAISSVLSAISGLNDLSQADVQAAMAAQGYTSIRASLLDNLDASITAVITAITGLNDLSSSDVQTAVISGMTSQGYTSSRAAQLELARKILTNRLELADGSVGNLVLYDDNDVDVLLTFNMTDVNGNPLVLPVRAPARRSKGA